MTELNLYIGCHFLKLVIFWGARDHHHHHSFSVDWLFFFLNSLKNLNTKNLKPVKQQRREKKKFSASDSQTARQPKLGLYSLFFSSCHLFILFFQILSDIINCVCFIIILEPHYISLYLNNISIIDYYW